MLMKTKLLPSLLTSMVVLSSGLFSSAAMAQSFPDVDSFDDVARRWGYDCRPQNEGYYCTKASRRRGDRWGSRDDRSRDQRSDRFNSGRLFKGTVLPTQTRNRDRLTIRRNETVNLTLYVERDIRSDNSNRVVIPQNSRIEGRLRPRSGGVEFEADRLVLTNGRSYNLEARSEIIYPNNRGPISTSSTGREILSTILGDRIDRRDDGDRDGNLVVIFPNRDLDLRLTEDLNIN
ncbi:MAG: hypothetical protein HC934_13360 [Acaryochloridaceae cyanobacterium SU_2_1]|nr:hypothetical protein [Acaryochloridaceae cyanobacterium SU_2_1]